MTISSASMTIRSAFERRSGSKEGFESFANWDTGTLVGHCARIVVASGVPISPKHAGHGRIAARGRVFGVCNNRRSQRTGWLHFKSERPSDRRGFWRRRSPSKRTIEPGGQPERAVAGLSAPGGTEPDSGSVEAHRVVRPLLFGTPKGQCFAP